MNERSPLLPSQTTNTVHPKSSYQKYKSTWTTWRIPLLCYSLALLLDSGEAMRATPKTRLFEMILCERYYTAVDTPLDSREIPETMCKVSEVQSAVVDTQVWLRIMESLFALITAIPFGKLSNTKGRKFVLILGISGQILAEAWILAVCYFRVPFGAVYASAVFKSLGGGEMVLSAIVHAILADAVSEDRRARAFFHTASMTLLAQVIAPLVGSALMQVRGVYAPLLCGFPVQVVAVAVSFLMPTSVDRVRGDAVVDGFAERAKPGFNSLTVTISRKIKTSWTLLRENSAILLVAVSFMATYSGKETLDFLVQYVSKRFGWSLAKANYLISFSAITNLTLYLLILPGITKTLATRYPPKNIDLWIARTSSIFGIIGPILLGLSPTPALLILSLVIFTLAFGYPHAIQSYGTSLVQPVDIAPFYSFLAMVRIAGRLVVSPLMAGSFTLGLKTGGVALGMPFYLAGVLFGVGGVAAWVGFGGSKISHIYV